MDQSNPLLNDPSIILINSDSTSGGSLSTNSTHNTMNSSIHSIFKDEGNALSKLLDSAMAKAAKETSPDLEQRSRTNSPEPADVQEFTYQDTIRYTIDYLIKLRDSPYNEDLLNSDKLPDKSFWRHNNVRPKMVPNEYNALSNSKHKKNGSYSRRQSNSQQQPQHSSGNWERKTSFGKENPNEAADENEPEWGSVDLDPTSSQLGGMNMGQTVEDFEKWKLRQKQDDLKKRGGEFSQAHPNILSGQSNLSERPERAERVEKVEKVGNNVDDFFSFVKPKEEVVTPKQEQVSPNDKRVPIDTSKSSRFSSFFSEEPRAQSIPQPLPQHLQQQQQQQQQHQQLQQQKQLQQQIQQQQKQQQQSKPQQGQPQQGQPQQGQPQQGQPQQGQPQQGQSQQGQPQHPQQGPQHLQQNQNHVQQQRNQRNSQYNQGGSPAAREDQARFFDGQQLPPHLYQQQIQQQIQQQQIQQQQIQQQLAQQRAIQVRGNEPVERQQPANDNFFMSLMSKPEDQRRGPIQGHGQQSQSQGNPPRGVPGERGQSHIQTQIQNHQSQLQGEKPYAQGQKQAKLPPHLQKQQYPMPPHFQGGSPQGPQIGQAPPMGLQQMPPWMKQFQGPNGAVPSGPASGQGPNGPGPNATVPNGPYQSAPPGMFPPGFLPRGPPQGPPGLPPQGIAPGGIPGAPPHMASYGNQYMPPGPPQFMNFPPGMPHLSNQNNRQ